MDWKECKLDQGKARLDFSSSNSIEAIGEIMTYGLEKYYEGSWKEVEPKRYRAALMRHMCDT